jgi:hypothetical protein
MKSKAEMECLAGKGEAVSKVELAKSVRAAG